MKKMLLAITFVIIFSPPIPTSAGDNGTNTVNRLFDPVVVTGNACRLTDRPPADYGLYAVKDNQLRPIPFQIDEKDADGNFVLTRGKVASADVDPAFDDNDELVFMAMDAGDKLSCKDLLPAGSTDCAELEINDPGTLKKTWVYLVTSNRPQKKSNSDYVTYDDDKPSFATRNYSGRYDDGHPVGACRYTFERGVDGDGDDFIDRIKIRLTMRSIGVTLHRSEEDIKVKELGYIDGPVRVIVYSKNVTPLVLGIPASSTKQYTYYYDSFADFAFAASFPLKPGFFRATVIDDFKNAKGWTFYNSNNPRGHVIDGKMDDSDKALDRSTWSWSALDNGKQCFWSVWTAPPGCPVKAALYFNDDESAKDELEDDRGELPGIGFDFNTGWDRLEADSVELRLVHFYTRAYHKGMEKEIRNVFDAPLQVTSNIL